MHYQALLSIVSHYWLPKLLDWVPAPSPSRGHSGPGWSESLLEYPHGGRNHRGYVRIRVGKAGCKGSWLITRVTSYGRFGCIFQFVNQLTTGTCWGPCSMGSMGPGMAPIHGTQAPAQVCGAIPRKWWWLRRNATREGAPKVVPKCSPWCPGDICLDG